MTKQLPEQFNDPEKYRLLESGAIMEIATGKLVGNIGGPYAITKENAGAMLRKRWDDTYAAVGEAVLREVKSFADVPTNTPREAFAYIAGKQAVALADSEKPRVEDLEKLGQLMGEVPRNVELRNGDPGTMVDAMHEALLRLASEFAGTIPADVVDALAKDVE